MKKYIYDLFHHANESVNQNKHHSDRSITRAKDEPERIVSDTTELNEVDRQKVQETKEHAEQIKEVVRSESELIIEFANKKCSRNSQRCL